MASRPRPRVFGGQKERKNGKYSSNPKRPFLSLAPADIASAEQALIENGFPAKLVQQLSMAFVFMGALDEQSINPMSQLPPGHLLRKILAEHDLTRCLLVDLRDVTQTIDRADYITDTNSEFRKLAHIAMHLSAMEEHFEREDDVIFPILKKHGWTTLCSSVESDHAYLKIAIGDLVRLVKTFDEEKFEEFRIRLKALASYLCPAMWEHLLQEDNVLYPIALEIVDDKKVWDKVKSLCDEIGYCGTHV